MSSTSPGCVVVGVDRSPAATEALDWAAQEAALRGARLCIGHSSSMEAYDLPDGELGILASESYKAAKQCLDRAAARVRERHPDMDVVTELLREWPLQALLQLADAAQLIVVGSRGPNMLASVLLGSVSQGLVAHSDKPVAVVRAGVTGATPGGTAMSRPVVVGVASDETAACVDFAFAEAQMRGVPLLAVRSWMAPQAIPGHMVATPREKADRARDETAQLESALAAGRAEYPGVSVTTSVALSEPEALLVTASRDSCMVVVASRRRRSRFAPPVGRVTHRVLHHAQAPVVVVPA
jgi:nucleotide-binding universal stress UspA family protein